MQISITPNKINNNKNIFVFAKERESYKNIYVLVKVPEKLEKTITFD